MIDPNSVLDHARQNTETWLPKHRDDGMAARNLRAWQHVLDGGVDDVVAVLVGTDERSCELRQNSPFAGVLSDGDRLRVLSAFREYWCTERTAR